METIKIVSSENASTPQQFVEITPDPVQPPTRKIPVEQYVAGIKNEMDRNTARNVELQAKLDELTKQGLDLTAVKASRVAMPFMPM